MNDVCANLLQRHGVDAAMISHLPKVRRLCGFSGSRALLLVRPDKQYLVTDPRYAIQAAAEVFGADVVVDEGAFCRVFRRRGLLQGADRVLFESGHWTAAELSDWQQTFPEKRWVPGRYLLQHFVARKSDDALGRMRRAQAITEAAFDHILQTIAPGMTERELAAEVVYTHLRAGADRMSFDPIVASGPNSALPHAQPTDRRIRQGDVVLLDMGCMYRGYASDMTRVVALGEPANNMVRRVYEVVLRAQEAAMAVAKGGMQACTLDAAARRVIESAGYGSSFHHSLGHGIGLEVHEWPRVSQRSEDRLLASSTITIEPGIYLQGEFGIRIEDVVLLRDGGCERLGGLSRELHIA